MARKLSEEKKVPTSVQKWKTLAAEWRVLGLLTYFKKPFVNEVESILIDWLID